MNRTQTHNADLARLREQSERLHAALLSTQSEYADAGRVKADGPLIKAVLYGQIIKRKLFRHQREPVQNPVSPGKWYFTRSVVSEPAVREQLSAESV